jgi:hypothetical protein
MGRSDGTKLIIKKFVLASLQIMAVKSIAASMNMAPT